MPVHFAVLFYSFHYLVLRSLGVIDIVLCNDILRINYRIIPQIEESAIATDGTSNVAG